MHFHLSDARNMDISNLYKKTLGRSLLILYFSWSYKYFVYFSFSSHKLISPYFKWPMHDALVQNQRRTTADPVKSLAETSCLAQHNLLVNSSRPKHDLLVKHINNVDSMYSRPQSTKSQQIPFIRVYKRKECTVKPSSKKKEKLVKRKFCLRQSQSVPILYSLLAALLC